MSLDQPNDPMGPEIQRPLDPIARNEKDMPDQGDGRSKISRVVDVLMSDTSSHEAIQPANVTRRSPLPSVAGGAPAVPGPPWGMHPAAHAAASPTELLASILRFKWTIVLISIMVSAPAIALIWTQIVPKYDARAEIRVRPIIPRLVFRTEESGPIPFYGSFVNTQVSIVRSLTVLQRVLDQRDVQQTRWYTDPSISPMQKLRGNTPPPIERLRDNLVVRPRPRTEIIDVSFLDPSATDAKVIVNAVLDQYTRYTAEKADATEDELYRQLLTQYQTLEKDIQGRELTCAELHKSLGTEMPQELISAKRVRLDETHALLSRLQQSIAVLEWEIAPAAIGDSNDTGTPLAGMVRERPPYHQDADWRTLDMNVRTMEHHIAGTLYGPNHPERLKLNRELDFAKELRQLREAQLDEQWDKRPTEMATLPGASAVAGLSEGNEALTIEHQLARAKREEQLLRGELEQQQAEFKTLFESAQLLQRENSLLRQKRDLFDAVRQRLEEKNVERNVPGAIEVLMRAYAPSEPAGDRRVVFTAMALFAGLGMGGGAAFLRASRNQSIYTPKDMPQPVQVPFLGYVPLIRTKNLPGKGLFDEITQNRVLLTESIRFVRTALLSRLNGKSPTAVLITSAAAGTGKSSFTRILAKSMAQAGKRVLVIDADFHKVTLSKWFNLLDKPGFMDSLAHKTIDGRHIHATDTPGLSIMPAGQRGDNGGTVEEISNGAFKACMSQLSRQHNYDIILLDSPPLLPVADSSILAGQVDGTILVERESLSQRADVADALARLISAGGRLLGTVFVGSGGSGHYGYAYNYYRKGRQS